MSVKIISYDLGGPETSSDYAKIRDYMYTHGTRAKPLESFWLLETSKSCSTLVAEIKSAAQMDSNDKLLVFEWSLDDWTLSGLDQSIVDWLRARN